MVSPNSLSTTVLVLVLLVLMRAVLSSLHFDKKLTACACAEKDWALRPL
jgi:hypothetical protein